MDAVVIFDNVLVPWERLFMYREPLLCNHAFSKTNAVVLCSLNFLTHVLGVTFGNKQAFYIRPATSGTRII